MNTLSLFSAAGAIHAGAEMNTLRLFSALSRKFSRNENFLLAIPFFAHELLAVALRGGQAQCERCSCRVGNVPRRVRKVSFRKLWPQTLVTLVNNVF
ncbi:hypothetical protein ACSFA2_21610 [Variovorax sp. LT2P21]|uniref:hypothetical protein n=1 Tax=Variovorax sp. LT2P21 TaxID=3443731 RepID=UPI003F483D28